MAGTQPKVAVRLVDGKYVMGLTEEERWQRYDACEDLALQLAAYCTRKSTLNPEWTRECNLERAGRGMADKVRRGLWDVSPAEQRWVMARVRSFLEW
ncbi:hypothetical protein F6X42_18820 [Paraburkholderia sp. WC7.3b]|uniref:Uncharacterized protein n=1 Tax=Paraburkholderia podalyriae TaxID=1938811 RepID=A0ABR7PQP9_9BURK|nr:hypothetical protein [Paraburkholderia podalyriae]